MNMEEQERSKVEFENEINQETKEEIKELFDELFVRKFEENISFVSEQAKEKHKEISKLCEENKKEIRVVNDSLDKIIERLGDDWEEDTLKSAINLLLQQIANGKNTILEQTKCLIGEWKDKALIDRLNEVTEDVKCLSEKVTLLEEQSIEPNLIKLYSELEWIKETLTKANILEEHLCRVSDRIKVVNDCQNETILKLEEDILSINEIKNKIILLEDKVNNMEISFQRILDSKEDKLNENMRTIVTEFQGEIQEKTEYVVANYKNRMMYTYGGLGFLFFSNIVMIILMLLR